jgi:Ca2+-binding RTX toxin-like protein
VEPGTTLRVAFPQSEDDIPSHFLDMDESDDFAGGYAFFSAAQQQNAIQALETWSDVADIQFEIVAPGEDADIYFYAMAFNVEAGAVSSGVDADHGSRIAINTAAGAWPDMEPGTFGFHALIHETGHSLGLSHPGPYDANDKVTPTYEANAEYIEDTTMYSVMSYFGSDFTGFDGNGDPPSFLVTPRSHDMYVMHELYGANWDARAGNTTYGYNADGVSALFDFTNYGGTGEQNYPQLTIWDGGGEDWLDLSGDGSGVTLDLRPGAFSSTHGMTFDISLAYVPDDAPDEFAGYIENARGGDGNDEITGNDRNNVLVGGEGDDMLFGLGGDDELRGEDGDDELHGDDGDDELLGGDGNDWLQGGLGTDSFDGEAGVDTLDFTYSDGNWTVSLSGVLDDPYDIGILGSASAGGEDESIRDVENVTMGSGNDHVTGSSLDNTLYGKAGNDTLIGLAGDDILFGGAGNDTLDGGNQSDELYGDAGDDRILGGGGDDHVDAGLGSDTIDGGSGNDTLLGSDGGDIIEGGLGNDTISGGDGGDNISGGLDVDDLDGGNGIDLLNYTFSADDWTVDLILETATPEDGLSESVRNFEHVSMGSGDDIVRATAASNSLYGGAGNDQLFGFGGMDWLGGDSGDDLLNGGAGNDFLIGGKGYDLAIYADDLAGVTVDLNKTAVSQNTGGSGSDWLQEIEGLIGSQHNDTLIGNAVNNLLSGGLGADQLVGGNGHDTLRGEGGDDRLSGGLGNDVLSGGDGTDWADYTLDAAAVTIDLTTQNDQNTIGAGIDQLFGIENVAGTAYNDTLIGNSSANRLEGNAGNDVLTGGSGGDVLLGGGGNDSLNGGTGNDVLEGGTGIDWALYNTGLSAAVTVDLSVDDQNTGGGGIDTLHDIENVMGTSFGDSLTGNNSANELRGEAGNDGLSGNGGNDVLNGGSGNDAIDGGSGADDIIGNAGNDHLWGGTGADDFIFGSGWGDDWIWDFQSGSDKIDLSGVAGLDSFNQLDVENTDSGALYTFGSYSILLVDVSALSVQTTDFII